MWPVKQTASAPALGDDLRVGALVVRAPASPLRLEAGVQSTSSARESRIAVLREHAGHEARHDRPTLGSAVTASRRRVMTARPMKAQTIVRQDPDHVSRAATAIHHAHRRDVATEVSGSVAQSQISSRSSESRHRNT